MEESTNYMQTDLPKQEPIVTFTETVSSNSNGIYIPTLREKLSSIKLLISAGLFCGGMWYLAFYNQEVCIKLAEEAARAGLYMLLMYVGYKTSK